MSRLQNIILRVRDTLADPNGDRWTDDRLLRLANEAQLDIVRRAKLLRETTIVYLTDGKGLYKLPDDLLLIDRVVKDGAALPFTSHMQLDRLKSDWEDDIGEVQSIVYDKHNRHDLKLYPIPITNGINYDFVNPGYLNYIELMSDDFGVIVSVQATDCSCSGFNSDFGVAAECAELSLVRPINGNDLFGVVADIDDYKQSDYFGVTAYIDNDTQIDDYGVLTNMNETTDNLKVYYLRKPKELSSLDDNLEIDDIFDSAIKYYITGKALRDDMDTQNRVVGNEELSFYDRDLKEAIKDDELDFTRNSNKQYYANYKGAFDG